MQTEKNLPQPLLIKEGRKKGNIHAGGSDWRRLRGLKARKKTPAPRAFTCPGGGRKRAKPSGASKLTPLGQSSKNTTPYEHDDD